MTFQAVLQPIVNLAKARELLLRESKSLMPTGAMHQRDEMVETLERIIISALTDLPLPEASAELDDISRSALDYLSQVNKPPVLSTYQAAYANLMEVFAACSKLELSGGILSWLQSTHLLPRLAPETLEDALSAVQVFYHRQLTQPEIKDLLARARQETDLTNTETRNLELMAQQWIQQAGLSESFVDALSRANQASFRIWETARTENDFQRWLPAFTEVVRLGCEKAELLGQALAAEPYQALLDQYNPGLHHATVIDMFAQLQAELPELIRRVTQRQAALPAPTPLPPVAVDVQRRIMRRLLDALGFEPLYSRMDESAHPFSTGEWDDVRITTHFHEDNLLSAVMSVVHEMGHAFYSRNLPRQWKYQPIGAAQSMWIHESQSLFWEKQVACSREFMEFLSPILREEIGSDDPAWGADNLYALTTKVKPGLIRIEADEVTYPAHVVLRHALEQELVAGTLAPAEMPAAWAERMRSLLGVEVPDDRRGCMQDVHWTDGTFGYFPAYTFGALAAAQFAETAKGALDLPGLIRRGEFAPIQHWLKTHVHEQGSRVDGETLVAQVTGETLSIQPWLRHIRARYLAA